MHPKPSTWQRHGGKRIVAHAKPYIPNVYNPEPSTFFTDGEEEYVPLHTQPRTLNLFTDGEEEYVPLYQSLTTQEAADKVIALSRKNSEKSKSSEGVDISEHPLGMHVSNPGSPQQTPRGGESESRVPPVASIVPKYPQNSVGPVAANPPQYPGTGTPAQHGHTQSSQLSGMGLATPRHQNGVSEFDDYNSSNPDLQKTSTPRVEMLTTFKTPKASPRVPQYPPMSIHKASPAPLPPGTMSPLVKDPAGSESLTP